MRKNKDWLLWALFTRLRRYRFPLDSEDYESLRVAMHAGFGWESLEDLRQLIGALWAKSLPEQEVVYALFDQLIEQSEGAYSWILEAPSASPEDKPSEEKVKEEKTSEMSGKEEEEEEASIELENKQGLPPIDIDPSEIPHRPLLFLPQYPVSYREAAQAFRRLRKPIRMGPKAVLDLDATIKLRSQRGVITPAVLVPHQLNVFKLVVFVDRYGSMLPFHSFIKQVVISIIQSARLESVSVFYFHDTPAVAADYNLLKPYLDKMMPTLDGILPEIKPISGGRIYKDDGLLEPVELLDVLKSSAAGALAVIISDGGAARGNYDPARLLDTISFMKGLKEFTRDYVWLNPAAHISWKNTTAEQIGRHLPMFPLDVPGLYQTVNTLRGQPYFVEKPL